MPNLKQGTLSFGSAKRTNSAPTGKSQQKTPGSEKRKNKRVETSVEAEGDAKAQANKVHEISSDEEDATPVQIAVPAKRTRAAQPSSGITRKAHSQPQPQYERQKFSPAVIEREYLDAEDKAGRYRKYYNEVRSKMGYIPPVHSEGQNKIHQMLRFFDMSYEFGPCIGMTRLERWERAEAFGLNPPVEVRDILLTKEGVENYEYIRCALDSEV